MQRLSGKSFDVTLGDLKLHIEKASLDIEDGSEVANHYQPKRGATYDHAWWQASQEAERLDRRPPPPSIWRRIRARIARVFV